jgi:uncharacterized membrane protein YkgB
MFIPPNSVTARNFVYRQPAGEYKQHMNREGALVPANRAWHERNGTTPLNLRRYLL